MDRIGGHRFTISHARIGGVANDLTDEATALIKEFIGNFPNELRDYHMLLDRNRLFYERNAGICVLETEEAIRLGATGPVLRGCGYPMDSRKLSPYLKSDEVECDVPSASAGCTLAGSDV